MICKYQNLKFRRFLFDLCFKSLNSYLPIVCIQIDPSKFIEYTEADSWLLLNFRQQIIKFLTNHPRISSSDSFTFHFIFTRIIDILLLGFWNHNKILISRWLLIAPPPFLPSTYRMALYGNILIVNFTGAKSL